MHKSVQLNSTLCTTTCLVALTVVTPQALRDRSSTFTLVITSPSMCWCSSEIRQLV
ncbi:hypothetical protein PR002_g32327 [Phytophthora rubi]|uniref:RxLR effector protein n=1 Tax=Phytophthora rubi TaxID=129364 RepID=A0A6A3GAV6_9STRA|nr:hypothetical protein PR002_g32327 [Phytophthora rubi]